VLQIDKCEMSLLSLCRSAARLPRQCHGQACLALRHCGTAPSYSSTGSLDVLVTSLGLNRISTMIMSGKPNRPFPAELGVDLETMTDGGKQAISVVTRLLESEQFDQLEGLVSPQCALGLEESIRQLSDEEKKKLSLRCEDIFFTFIPQFKFEAAKQSILLVTFSLPGLDEIKQIIANNRKQFEETFEQVKQQVEEGKLEKEKMKETLNESLKLTSQRLQHQDPHLMFKNADIVIGNYRFERDNSNSDWTIVEAAQVNSVKTWAWVFRKRWKGRLAISMQGPSFNTVLRVDYITDWFFFLILWNLITIQFSGGPPSASS